MFDFKNLNSHAFPLFKAGHIQKIEVALDLDNNNCLCRCICLPEMKKDIVYKVVMHLTKSSEIVFARCECPAGVGPHGSCKHIAAFCYSLEEYCRLQTQVPCTSRLQTWNQPRKRHLDPANVMDIDFANHEYGKVKRKPPCTSYDPRPSHLRSTTNLEVERLRNKLLQSGKEIALLHVISAVESPDISACPPPQYRDPALLRNEILHQLKKQQHPLKLIDIISAGNEFLESLKCSNSEASSIERQTRSQSLSKRWFEEREERRVS